MRTPTGLTLAMLLAGCAGGAQTAVQVTGPTTRSASETMDCVTRQLDDMAYQVASSGQQANALTAIRRNEQPWWLKMIGYRDTADQLSVSLEQGQLRVTAISSDPTDSAAGGTGGNTAGSTASAGARRDAQRLLGTCGAAR